MDMNKATIDKIERGYRMDKPDFAPSQIYDIMLQCWSTNPEKRPSFTMLSESIGAITNYQKLSEYKLASEGYDRVNRLRRVPLVDYLSDVLNPYQKLEGALAENEDGYLKPLQRNEDAF